MNSTSPSSSSSAPGESWRRARRPDVTLRVRFDHAALAPAFARHDRPEARADTLDLVDPRLPVSLLALQAVVRHLRTGNVRSAPRTHSRRRTAKAEEATHFFSEQWAQLRARTRIACGAPAVLRRVFEPVLAPCDHRLCRRHRRAQRRGRTRAGCAPRRRRARARGRAARIRALGR